MHFTLLDNQLFIYTKGFIYFTKRNSLMIEYSDSQEIIDIDIYSLRIATKSPS